MRRLDRWRWVRAGLTALCGTLAIAGVPGCTQHHFMTEADYKSCNQMALCGATGAACEDPADMRRSPELGVNIRTISSPEAKPRDVTLAECLALALERGRTGENYRSFANPGGLPLASGPANGQSLLSDAVRVFAYDPAIRSIDTEQSLAKFDPFFRSGMTWNKVDRPVGSALDTFRAHLMQFPPSLKIPPASRAACTSHFQQVVWQAFHLTPTMNIPISARESIHRIGLFSR